MTMAEQRLIDLVQKGHCDCLPVGPEIMDVDDLLITCYKPLKLENGEYTFGDEYIPIFSLSGPQNSRLSEMEEHGPSELISFRNRMNYNLYGTNQRDFTKRKIYSRVPVDWKTGFKTLHIGDIKSPRYEVYQETCELTIDSVDRLALDDYRQKLTSEIKFSVFIENAEMQGELLGFHKSPFMSPVNPNVACSRYAGRFDEWRSDLSWISSNQTTLVNWSKNFNVELLSEFRSLVRWQKSSLKQFRDDNQLENTFLWLEILESPRRYVGLLKNYTELLNALFCQMREGCESMIQRYTSLQSDFMKVLSGLIDRSVLFFFLLTEQ